MAEPKKRMSVVRSKNRRRHQGVAKVALSACPKCGAAVASHQTCRSCLAESK